MDGKNLSDGRGERLKKLRGSRTLRDYADFLGLSHSTLAYAESEKRPITRSLMEKLLAHHPGLSTDWLLSGVGEPFPTEPVRSRRITDVVRLRMPKPIGRVAAGSTIEWFGDFPREEIAEPLEAEPDQSLSYMFGQHPQWAATSGPVYTLSVYGHSMRDRYPQWSILMVRKPSGRQSVKSGWDCILHDLQHPGNFTFKRVFFNHSAPGLLTLHALNSEIGPQIVQEQHWEFWGVVVGCLIFPPSE